MASAKGKTPDTSLKMTVKNRRSARKLVRGVMDFTRQTLDVPRGVLPLAKLIAREEDVHRGELASALDVLFDSLYRHPLTNGTAVATEKLRSYRLIPNEQSTEDLIRFVVDQAVMRSPVQVPDSVINEFWNFFDEMFSSPEIKGLGEMSLDMVRLVLQTYEPILIEIINILKASRRFNQWQVRELSRRATIVRNDVDIMRRQIKALRHIKPFFQADPKDFGLQARIVADMVEEFGPFFVKIAQAAAANTDFLPEEIARELAVFHEDVPAMTPEEVMQAFQETHGKRPEELYMDFDAAKPLRSGSIGCVYIAKKPFKVNGQEVLKEVVVKVGRQNLDREFTIGKMVLGLAIMSSQYWAPHSKLAPFLRAMQEQADEFVRGFQEELDFEREARIQSLFYHRSMDSNAWAVPELYSAKGRILEMEYLSEATSLSRALDNMPEERRRHFQKRLSERFLYTILCHIFFYNECHGDLHPGNIMVGKDGELFLIDWGNSVELNGKWAAVWRYVTGAVLADVNMLTDTLIEISTDPQANQARRDEIHALLSETLNKKGVKPLTRRNFSWVLARGGLEGLHKRGQAVMHLASNTQHLGLVVHGDYLHLSRSIFAAAGSFSTIYKGASRWSMARDLIRGIRRFPVLLAADHARSRLQRVAGRLLRYLPVPRRWLSQPLIAPTTQDITPS